MEFTAERAIVDLLPRYAHRRRAGWRPASTMGGRITLSEYLLLRRVAIERVDMPISFDQLRRNALDPYSTADPLLDGLPQLVAKHLLAESGDGYTLTPRGHEVLTRGERAANDYAASRIRLPLDDLARVASVLEDLTMRLHQSPEPAVKTHQDRVPLLRRFDARRTPPVRLEYALYALQRARDDAHISAWRAAGFRGPDIEVLSRIWIGEASTRTELERATRERLTPDHLAQVLTQLEQDGLIEYAPYSTALTTYGHKVRNEIERETDRVYFAPWPDIDAGWIRERLEELTAGFKV